MKVTHRWQGDEALRKMFRSLSQDMASAASVEALAEAVEPMRATAALLAPRGPGRGPHLADNIIVAETKFGANGKALGPGASAVAIGPSHRPSDHFYGYFQEFGTANHPAQPFMRPAYDQTRGEVKRRVATSLWAAIVRRVRGVPDGR